MNSKIAIIGMSGLFPGSSSNEAFWNNLMDGKDLTGMATAEDFGVDPGIFFEAGKGVVDKCYSIRGGYIRNFEFDCRGYQLSAEFLARQDKLYQWSLHVAREALRDSGYLDEKESLRKCGVVMGNLSFPTASSHKLLASVYTHVATDALRQLLGDPNFTIEPHKHQTPANEVLTYTPTGMISAALGLGGTHYVLDAACASSLYAIKLAADELTAGKTDLMLAGAVCASDQLFIHMGFSIFHAYAAADQKFVPLDRNSGGLVSSEGAGMVVLKRLEDADRDGDDIIGVIGSIGLSNDGRGKFLLSPNPKGQQLAFARAYTADVDPRQTQYLECHATGTPLGDITELNSIAGFFRKYNSKPLLGSVKSNMGHLLTAAGMTGLLKVLLSMRKGLIPPNINLDEALSSENGWLGQPQMITRPTPWNNSYRQAGINSFGFGGTNAHMVVQQYQASKAEGQARLPAKLQPLAITGMDVHFGDCTNLNEFYETIYFGKQHFKDLPKNRWKGFEEDRELLESYGFDNGKAPRGAYIEDFEIDLLRYKIQPKEAETLEPQQALILKVADRAIRDAGLKDGQNVAVLIAMEPELAIHQYLARWDLEWQLEEALAGRQLDLTPNQREQLFEACKNSIYHREGSQTPSQHTSFVGNIMASRIAALWDFTGPAFTVSCGDNSVFKALEIAQHMLSSGEVEAVVVGAVDFAGGLENVLLRNRENPLNTSAQPSLNLNDGEQGWLIGEGAGAVVLEAENAQPERTYARIDDINQHKPHPRIGYQELAATGIASLDEAEQKALLNQAGALTGKVALGSIKTNIGHTYAASGIAGLIKTALCLYYRFIPGIPNWEKPRDDQAFRNGPYYFPVDSRPWILEEGFGSRHAAVNGLDGYQLHLSEGRFHHSDRLFFLQQTMPQVVVLPGDSQKELLQQLSALEIALETDNPLPVIGQQFYRRFQEKIGQYRLVIIGDSKTLLFREIRFFKKSLAKAFAQQFALKTPRGSYFTPVPLGKAAGRIAFVYPGSSTAYTGLGKELFQLFPQLYNYFKQKEANLDAYLGAEYLYPKTIARSDVPLSIYEDSIAMMSVGVFYSACFTHLIQQLFKLKPDLAFGYSMGECSSMWYALEVWSAGETKEFRNSPIFRSRFAGNLELLAEHWNISAEEARERWVSLVLLAPVDKVQPLVDSSDKVYLTFINTDNEVIISGDRQSCGSIVQQLNCPTVEIPFKNIIHHSFCSREEEGLLKMHCFPIRKQADIDFYSSITLNKIPLESEVIARNSTAVCIEKVDFPRTVRRVYEEGARIFIELGANATCTGWIKSILKEKPYLAVSIDQKGQSNRQALVTMLAQLLSHGLDVDLSVLYPAKEIEVPSRSFRKKIIPGGNRIYDILLSENMKATFSTVAKVQQRAVALTGHAMEISREKSNWKVKPIKSESTISMRLDTHGSGTSAPAQPAELAENGLKLQDYHSGEQLEGKTIIFSQQDLEEFATGKIANVFGPAYAVIDEYRRRVMLPMNPYLLVSRVTGLQANLGAYVPSTMQTEYDIPYNAWFTTDRQIPWAVSVESGQCDLLLISYIGIDFQNKGDLVYRLLDCTLTFVDDLPYEGQTLRYDISINSFVRNGDNLLFFFSYRCYVEDRLVLKMDGGCAGFFTDEQLEEGSGVVYTQAELEAKRKAAKRFFTPLLQTQKTAFSKEDLRHLINGEIEKCFGNDSYFANGRNPSLRLPPEKILMLDRIVSVDVKGGAYGLGYIIAEKDLRPDDWYFPCHFRDDEVLAGSLQAEGGGNLLRFFMLMLGLQRLVKDARFQPVFDLPQKVRCRKQVTPRDTKLIYKLEIKEIGLVPNPYVIGDLEIISDGIVTVHFENLGLQLREKNNPKYLEKNTGIDISPRSEGALLNEELITRFALGNLSQCFGDEFKVYDGKPVSHQPNTDLQLISRVLSIDGERGQLSKPVTIRSEYDVPQNPWFYEENSAMTMPYSILMEIALQPCGLLGAYLGSTLQFPDKSLFFRNLDGEGRTLQLPAGTDFRGKTISNKAVLLSSVALGGTILQNYTFELSVDGEVFYRGKSSFGFFTKEMLSDQVGLDNGKMIAPWHQTEGLNSRDYMMIKLDSLYGKMKLYKAPPGKPHYRLAGGQLNLLDKLIIAKNKGRYEKGYIHATRTIHPYDWFFTCHFYEDPVMPGSLGVEAILQAMQVFALQQDLGKDFASPKFVQLSGHQTSWKYRGQILMHVKEMQLEVHIKNFEQRGRQMAIIADASLWNDEVRIYQLTDLALGIEEG